MQFFRSAVVGGMTETQISGLAMPGTWKCGSTIPGVEPAARCATVAAAATIIDTAPIAIAVEFAGAKFPLVLTMMNYF